MAINPRDLPDILSERRLSDKVIEDWGGSRFTYQDWHADLADVYAIYRGDWDVVWPDKVRTRALPKIPNFVQLAADARSRQITAARPTIVCRPERAGDKAKEAADKRERMLGAWWQENRLRTNLIPLWAFDAMSGGLTVCRVLPQWDKPPSHRSPSYERLNPALSFPSPSFTRGPFLDNFVYSYEEKVRTIEQRFKVTLDVTRNPQANPGRARVIQYYDDEVLISVLETLPVNGGTRGQILHSVLSEERHNLGRCPIVIGARATMDGIYRGEFMGGLGILNYWNKMMTLMLDDAVSKVYAPKTYYDIENPEEYGPDALLEKQSPQGSFEYVQPPNAPFTNLQMLHDLGGFARAATIFPPSSSGDPNESIISAAGISATQGGVVEDVRAIGRDILAPMLEAANELAFRSEEFYGGKKPKVIYAEQTNSAFRETYDPSKDINGNYRNSVVYGPGTGLDEVNTGVMTLQQWAGGEGIISRRIAMEQSPFVEDPQRVEKELLKEGLERAMIAGLQQQAAAGTITAQDLAKMDSLLTKDSVSLADAIAQVTPQPALAPQPSQTPPGAAPTAPGLAGAADVTAKPSLLPPLRSVVARR